MAVTSEVLGAGTLDRTPCEVAGIDPIMFAEGLDSAIEQSMAEGGYRRAGLYTVAKGILAVHDPQ